MEGCCAAADYAYDREQCELRIVALIEEWLQNPPSVQYNAAAVDVCLTVLQEVYESCTPESGAIDEACDRILQGTKNEGEECTDSDECASDANPTAYCDRASDEPSGICALPFSPLPNAKEGDPCGGTCTSGGICTGMPGVGSCHTEDGLFCDASRLCAPLREVGESCTSAECVAGSYCDVEVCVPLPEVGESCSAEGCVAGSYCDAGTCALRPVSGPCLEGSEEQPCATAAYCDEDSDQCMLRKPNLSPCEDDDECESRVCDDGCRVATPVSSRQCSGAP